MKYILAIVQLAFGLGPISLRNHAPAYPHGGGLDAYGCHRNRNADFRFTVVLSILPANVSMLRQLLIRSKKI
jgi:hypothetical protein